VLCHDAVTFEDLVDPDVAGTASATRSARLGHRTHAPRSRGDGSVDLPVVDPFAVAQDRHVK
jgi:hypothetical protein